jgi:hypothetical protein
MTIRLSVCEHLAVNAPEQTATDAIPTEFASRLGELTERGEHWGFLHVQTESVERRGLFGRRVLEPVLIEEFIRSMAPQSDAEDEPDVGWNDAFVRGDDIPGEIERLRRDELQLSGRTLAIRWLDGSEAQDVRRDYFPQ